MGYISSLKELSTSHPFLFAVSIFLIVLVTKGLPYLTKSRELSERAKEKWIMQVSSRLDILQARCGSLESELVEWKDKYYKDLSECREQYLSLQKELNRIEVDNDNLKQQVESLVKGKKFRTVIKPVPNSHS